MIGVWCLQKISERPGFCKRCRSANLYESADRSRQIQDRAFQKLALHGIPESLPDAIKKEGKEHLRRRTDEQAAG